MKNKLIYIFVVLLVVLLISSCEEIKGSKLVDGKNGIDNHKENVFMINKKIIDKNLEFFESRSEDLIYTIKYFNDGHRDVIPPKMENVPGRDRPRERFEMDRNYFDVNIITNEENEWVEDEYITILIYYEGLNIYSSCLEDYEFAENYRINLPDNIYRNDNFDVILSILRPEGIRDGTRVNRITMIEPLLDGESEVTFDLSNAERINTNLIELNQEMETNILQDSFIIKINNTQNLFRTVSGLDIKERNNKVYVSEDALNPDWNFLIVDESIPLNEESQTVMDVTINNIIYPLEEEYIISHEDLKQITFNIEDSFKEDFISTLYFNNYEINSERLPLEINYFFTENNFFNYAVIQYFDWSDDFYFYIKRKIPFEEYYEEGIELDVIKKPNALRLYNELSNEFSHPYLRGYLANNNYFNFSGYPNDYIDTFNLDRGFVGITTPNEDTYSSLSHGTGFFISCYEEGRNYNLREMFFPEMECVEGDYIIDWDFENIIKDRDIYLDAIVHYDGEDWEIIEENSRVVDRIDPRRPDLEPANVLI